MVTRHDAWKIERTLSLNIASPSAAFGTAVRSTVIAVATSRLA